MALHVGLRRAESVAGILAMSGYLLESEGHPCPAKTRELPIGMFHGAMDPMIPLLAAEHSVQAMREAGHAPELKRYPGLAHSVSEEEILDVFAWLRSVAGSR